MWHLCDPIAVCRAPVSALASTMSYVQLCTRGAGRSLLVPQITVQPIHVFAPSSANAQRKGKATILARPCAVSVCRVSGLARARSRRRARQAGTVSRVCQDTGVSCPALAAISVTHLALLYTAATLKRSL